jgi:hypothetical protein
MEQYKRSTLLSLGAPLVRSFSADRFKQSVRARRGRGRANEVPEGWGMGGHSISHRLTCV